MIKRLWHVLIVGHVWCEERVYLPPSDPDGRLLLYESDYHQRYGLTVVHRTCECGASQNRKLIGHFGAAGGPDLDLKELKRMARL